MLTWATASINSRPLGLARIIIGGAAILRLTLALPTMIELIDPSIVKVPFFDWLPAPSLAFAVVLSVVWLVSAVMFMLGWRVPLTGSILLAALLLYLFADQQLYGNHLYLMVWLVLLLTLADAGAGMNLAKRDRTIIRWPVLLVMLQMSLVYGFSGITKLNERFLSGSTLAGVLRDGIVPFPEALRTPAFLSVLAGLVVIVEVFLALMIWRPRFRPTAFILGLGLHISIPLLMAATGELIVFSLEMLAIYPLFLGDERLQIGTAPDSGWRDRIERLDWLRVADIVDGADQLTVDHRGMTSTGAAAHTRILEHLVPTLWVAPLLRLPGVRFLHERRHRRAG